MNVWQGNFRKQNTGDDGWLGTCPVDAYEPNGVGLLNTSGNVWEWCADRSTARPDDPRWLLPLSRLLLQRYRVAARSFNTPDSSTAHGLPGRPRRLTSVHAAPGRPIGFQRPEPG